MIAFIDEDTLRDVLLVFGGNPGESLQAKHLRFRRQVDLQDKWPTLHKALMNLIHLDEYGRPLPNPVISDDSARLREVDKKK